ncbi:MAG: choice-of-anchor D domain-containing protein, partial [Acidobacteriota bacterium]
MANLSLHPESTGASAASDDPLLDLPLGDGEETDPGGRPGDAEAPPAADEPAGGPGRPAAVWSHGALSRLLWPLVAVALAAGALWLGWRLRPDPPALSVQQVEIEFGDLPVGEEVVRPIVIANAGGSSLTLSEIELAEVEGTAAGLRVEENGCLRPLATEETCQVVVAWRPEAVGMASARLRLISNAPGGDRLLPIRGRATRGELAWSESRASFEAVAVGSRGALREVELRNVGDAPIRLREVALVGPAAGDFVRVADRCVAAILEPDASCRLAFELVPTVPGPRKARLEARAAGVESAAPLELLGEAIERTGRLVVEPTALDFGGLALGEVSAGQRVRLRNDGTAIVQGLRLALEGEETADATGVLAGFRVVESTC